LTDYLADRLAILGTVDDCIQRVKDLEALGVNQLFFYTALPDKEKLLTHIANDVIPAVGAVNN